LALALASEGVHVGLVARTEADLQDVASEIKNLGAKAAVGVADVSDIRSVSEAVSKIQQELGPVEPVISSIFLQLPAFAEAL
jgi:3-oxoacyl-[acyl-carrier protein] reductase